MSLYNKKVSELILKADNLFDQEGEPKEAILAGKEIIIKAGDKTLTIKISKDCRFIEIDGQTRKPGYGTSKDSMFKLLL